jgi:hypothetical protein
VELSTSVELKSSIKVTLAEMPIGAETHNTVGCVGRRNTKDRATVVDRVNDDSDGRRFRHGASDRVPPRVAEHNGRRVLVRRELIWRRAVLQASKRDGSEPTLLQCVKAGTCTTPGMLLTVVFLSVMNGTPERSLRKGPSKQKLSGVTKRRSVKSSYEASLE